MTKTKKKASEKKSRISLSSHIPARRSCSEKYIPFSLARGARRNVFLFSIIPAAVGNERASGRVERKRRQQARRDARQRLNGSLCVRNVSERTTSLKCDVSLSFLERQQWRIDLGKNISTRTCRPLLIRLNFSLPRV